jgi:hypothetical protein
VGWSRGRDGRSVDVVSRECRDKLEISLVGHTHTTQHTLPANLGTHYPPTPAPSNLLPLLTTHRRGTHYPLTTRIPLQEPSPEPWEQRGHPNRFNCFGAYGDTEAAGECCHAVGLGGGGMPCS